MTYVLEIRRDPIRKMAVTAILAAILKMADPKMDQFSKTMLLFIKSVDLKV